MAGQDSGKRNSGSTETNRSTLDAKEELKRTLDRDTAVQGEREEETAAATRSPAGVDDAPSSARPATAVPTSKKP